jgi:site-specific DNA-cytosine methylase
VAEIEKFPSAVLAHHYPDVPNVGDFTKIRGDEFGAIDVLVGGTPCQDFSVSGLRAGVKGERGNLTLEFIRLAERMQPKYVVWENVPGVLSADNGETIQKVIDMFTQIGYICDVDIHDAQEFGVPQRRRRVFLVCVKIADLLQTKTSTSDRIVLELLAQAWQSTWDAILPVLSRAKSHSESELQTVIPADFLLTRMRLLDALLGEPAVTKLLGYWDDPQAQSMAVPSISASTSPQSSARLPEGSKTAIGGSQKIVMVDEYGCRNTVARWANVLDAISAQTSRSITSTWTAETMEIETSSFAEALLITLLSIINSPERSLTQAWSSDYWNLASSLLTLTKGITAYAGSASCEMYSTHSIRDSWGNCIELSQAIADILERHIRDWERREEVLLIKDRLCRHPAPRREKGQVAPTIPSRSTGGGGLGSDFDCDGGVIEAVCMSTGQASAEIGIGIGTTLNCNHEAPIVTHSLRSEGFDASEDGTGRGTPLVPVAFVQNSRDEVRLMGGDGSLVGALAAETGAKQQCYVAQPYTLDQAQGQCAAFTQNQAGDVLTGDVMHSLGTNSNATGRNAINVAIGWSEELTAHEDCAGTVQRGGDGGRHEGVMTPKMQVRRLTPEECEKLQGFEPGYTKISAKTADGPRYRALGNSMAVPVMAWIGRRIQMVEEIA